MFSGMREWLILVAHLIVTIIKVAAPGGAGGQGVMVIPELDLVIGIFAGNYSSKAWKDVQQNYVPRYILPVVREAGDAKEAPVVWREDYSTPYGHSANSGPVRPVR